MFFRCRRADPDSCSPPRGTVTKLTQSWHICAANPDSPFLPRLNQAMRGNHKQAKHLFWRAIHACPGDKSVWMDALRGNQIARMGAAGLRPAFRTRELNELLDVMLEKALHLRAEPP